MLQIVPSKDPTKSLWGYLKNLVQKKKLFSTEWSCVHVAVVLVLSQVIHRSCVVIAGVRDKLEGLNRVSSVNSFKWVIALHAKETAGLLITLAAIALELVKKIETVKYSFQSLQVLKVVTILG